MSSAAVVIGALGVKALPDNNSAVSLEKGSSDFPLNQS